MATLDDKLLGEKTHYYCSSSEDEKDSEDEEEPEECQASAKPQSSKQTTFIPEPEIRDWEGSSVNTGPKGVLKDWQRFKQLENQKKEEEETERLALMKKLSLTCRSHKDEEKLKQEEDKIDQEIQSLLHDEFLNQYMQKRMQEMMQQVVAQPKYGSLIVLASGQEFLDAIDKEKKGTTVIIHIYADALESCKAMNGCLKCLAQEYPQVKFCCLDANSAGMSKQFEKSGVPALLIYRNGNLIGNFVRLSDELGDDFFATDVENYLVEHGMLPDQSLVPVLVQSDKNDDSDFDVE